MAWMAVADDLTGAADLAGRLAGRGQRVWVGREAPDLRGLDGSLILDAATRFLPPALARTRVQAAWRSLPMPAGPILRYQKIDSTLRGNPGPDVEGFLAATAAPWIALLPAYPLHGRRVLAGRLQVGGRPLMRTEYARDPLSPARTDSLAALLPGLPFALAPLALLRRGSGALRAWLRRAGRRARVIAFDCAEDGDVDRIAAACLAVGCRHFAGASALGAALAQRTSGPAQAARPHGAARSLPWALLVGSVSATSFAQLNALERAGWPWEALPPQAGSAWARSLRPRLRRHGALALSSLPGRKSLAGSLSAARARGISPDANARRALDRLIQAGLTAAGGLQSAAWFLTGGHTLERFLGRIRSGPFETLGELVPGVPLSVAHAPGGQALFASKPGGFGDEGVLIRFLRSTRA